MLKMHEMIKDSQSRLGSKVIRVEIKYGRNLLHEINLTLCDLSIYEASWFLWASLRFLLGF